MPRPGSSSALPPAKTGRSMLFALDAEVSLAHGCCRLQFAQLADDRSYPAKKQFRAYQEAMVV